MYERVQLEINLLKEKYPGLQFGPELNWILLPKYPLPPLYNFDQTPLLWLVPPGYPQTGPDDFFTDGGNPIEKR